MAKLIELHGVSLSYPIYSIRAQSLRNAVINLAVGGKLVKDGHDVIYVNALDNVSFSLEQGDRMGIVGHNGAGKTTLLKVLAGVYEPGQGLIRVSGRISSMVNIGLGIDHEQTGRENIVLMARRRGFTLRQIQAKMPSIIDFSELGQYIDLPLKSYSAGMAARLVFSVATSFDPDILLLDEWIGAGDAGFVDKASEKMRDIMAQSRIMVLATHNFDMVQRVCNKVLVMESGRQIYFGDVSGWDFVAWQPTDVH